MNERVLPQVQAAEMGFLRRLRGLTLRDKVSWISSRFSEKRDPCYVGPTICPECPKNDWRGKSCWLHLQESGPEALKSPGSVSKSPILLDPYLRLLLIVRYFEFSEGCCLCNPPKRKSRYDNEGITLPWKQVSLSSIQNLLISKQSILSVV